MNIETIPQEIRSSRQLVVWKRQERKGKVTKVPFCPTTRSKADTMDPETWGDIDDCLNALESGKFDGIGYVFTKEAGIVGIDLDHCIDRAGNALSEFATGVVKTLPSYTEISPSGDGLHIFVKGELPGKGVKRNEIEIYDQGRFFTVTGDTFGDPHPICQGGETLQRLYQRYAKTEATAEKAQVIQFEAASNSVQSLIDEFVTEDYNCDVWDHRVPMQSQSEYDLAIASLALHRGYSETQAVQLIQANRTLWNANPAKASQTGYIRDTLTRAASGTGQQQPLLTLVSDNPHPQSSKDLFPCVLASSLVQNPTPIEWIIEGYIPDKGIIWLAGEWSTCKSFIAFHMCMHIAMGREWCGRYVRQVPVVFITGEGETGVGRRIAALYRHLDIPDEVTIENLLIIPCSVMINEASELMKLHKTLQRFCDKAGLIVLDTKSANMLGSDSDAGNMNDWINAVRRLEQAYKCTILVIDHVGHMAKDRPRGASQQLGAADACYMVERNKHENLIKLRTEKDPKDFESPPEVAFETKVIPLPAAWKGQDGKEVTSLVVDPLPQIQITPSTKETPTPSASSPSRLGTSMQKAYDVLKDMYRRCFANLQEANRPYSMAKVEMREWKRLCIEDGITRSSLTGIEERLTEAGLVRVEGVHIYLTAPETASY